MQALVWSKQAGKLAFVVSLLMMLVLAGCGPRLVESSAAASDPNQLTVDLPSATLEVGADGQATLPGLPLAALGVNIDLGPSLVEKMASYNIQHVQVSNTQDGLRLVVNNQLMPSPVWEAESMQNLQALLKTMDQESVAGLLPIIRSMQFGAVLKFPAAAGKAAIPVDSKVLKGGPIAPAKPPKKYALDLGYTCDAAGDCALASGRVLPALKAALEKIPLGASLIESFGKWGVKKLSVSITADSLILAMDEKPLPRLNLANGELGNILALVEGAGLLPPEVGAQLPLIKTVLPALQKTGIRLTFNF